MRSALIGKFYLNVFCICRIANESGSKTFPSIREVALRKWKCDIQIVNLQSAIFEYQLIQKQVCLKPAFHISAYLKLVF